MNPSIGNKVGARVTGWLGSSILSVAVTILFISWLVAYAWHPTGTFVHGGLVLAVAAYGIDLVREGRSSGSDLPQRPARPDRLPLGLG